MSTGLRTVDQGEWDRLAAATSFYQSYSWLRAVERLSPAAVATYVTISGARGQTIGATPWYEPIEDPQPRYHLPQVLGGLTSRWPRKACLAGTRRDYHNACLVDGTIPRHERRHAVARLVEAVADGGRAAGADAMAWLYLPTAAAAELAEVAGVTPVLLTVHAELRLPGEAMADYWASFRGAQRASLRKEEAVFDGVSYEVAVERLGDCYDEAGPLLGQVERKYGHRADDAAMIESLRVQAEHVDVYSRVFTCRRAGRLVGFALFYEWAGRLYARVVGFDYPALASCYEYFNLLFYKPIAYAYAHGIRTVQLGIESREAKRLRGATLAPLWAVLTPLGWQPPPDSDINAWNRRMTHDKPDRALWRGQRT